ncbi:MAG: Uncharacterized protein FD155_2331 [Bacteroidetes bacterium]|nr:MAG: Uncharacterized protein FD155_2331 [Bacteroidota bacterium]
MKTSKTDILRVIGATVWISLSEFFRNEFLLKSFWKEHYQQLGIVFPSDPVNGAVWGLWSLLLALFIYMLHSKFNFIQTSLISWFSAFLMMWVVTGNLGVLPFNLLFAAIPLSLIEVFVAAYIIHKPIKTN